MKFSKFTTLLQPMKVESLAYWVKAQIKINSCEIHLLKVNSVLNNKLTEINERNKSVISV